MKTHKPLEDDSFLRALSEYKTGRVLLIPARSARRRNKSRRYGPRQRIR